MIRVALFSLTGKHDMTLMACDMTVTIPGARGHVMPYEVNGPGPQLCVDLQSVMDHIYAYMIIMMTYERINAYLF
jgi:hypothetical protein